MKTTGDGICARRAVLWLAGSLVVWSAMPAAAPAATQEGITPPGGALVERPGPFGSVTKRFFKDNPDCVSAKLDAWIWRGRYTHQLVTARSGVESAPGMRPGPGESAPSTQQTWEGDKANPATRQIMDADSTTILVGREGCRYRIRIERAD
jgi:hypothetical protein